MSVYLLAAVLAWILSQGAKYLLQVVHTHSFADWRQLYISGGMPSAHSATMMAVTTLIGLSDGIQGGLFGFAVLVSGIVMYDAVMVRRSSGAQGMALKQLLKETKSQIHAPRVAKGHEPLEVLVGAFVGAAVGYVVFLVTT